MSFLRSTSEKKLEVQAYDDYLHIYSNTNLVTIYKISDLDYNSTLDFQEELVKMSYGRDKDEKTIRDIAKDNLKRIGEIYK